MFMLLADFVSSGLRPVLSQAGAQPTPQLFENLLQYAPLVAIVAAAWMLLYRPERQRQQQHKELLAALKKNDRVLTAGGIYGTVANVQRDIDRVTIRIDESNSVKIDVTLASIARVLQNEPSESAT